MQAHDAEPATAAPAQPAAAPSPISRDRPLWGLALSGGGIRSATFCFGVLTALARQGLLLRFSLLSTVSGGGFIGALVGKLFHDAARAKDVEDALADADTRWFTWWLRANANYLFARGARDVYVAAATMLRNLIALHIELAVLALVVAALLAAVNLGTWWVIDAQLWRPDSPGLLQAALQRLPTWLPTLWLVVPGFVFAAGCVVCAYWALPHRIDTRGLHLRLFGWGVALVLTFVLVLADEFLRRHLGLPKQLRWTAVALAAMWVIGLPLALWLRDRAGFIGDDAAIEDRLRHRLTGWSAVLLRWGLLVLAVGALDRLAWFLAFQRERLLETGAVLTLSALVLRTVLPRLGGSSGAAPGWLGSRLLLLAHLAGLALTLLLLAWWMALAYKQTFDIVFVGGNEGLQFGAGAAVAAVLGGGAAAFLVATGRNVAFANLSSLHRYFKVRLVRGWLGAANPHRMPAGSVGRPSSVCAARGAEPLGGYNLPAEVGDAHDGDDVPLRDYAPQHAGGPLHLVNACLNHSVRNSHSRDGAPAPRSFNPARKGESLTVAPGGWLRVGTQPWQRLPDDADALSLGAWTAISGAAFAPGLGTMTRSGIAALAMFAGVRLGCWWDTRPWQPRAVGPRRFIKSALLLSELLGRFQGAASRFWYLSDGGHFENTGVYALLRERTELIVLADCGADPQYRFADLENLVRLARVDLGAKIHFLKPDATFADPLWRRFGSVGDLASSASDACMALAEVIYADDRPDAPSRGWLVLLKPNMFTGLPVDLINYRNANPEFPQQPTSDQGFDEAQWESYYALGREIGKQLDATLLERIAAGEADVRHRRFKRDDGRQLAAPVAGKNGGGLRERLASGAVGASIGLTTAVTAGVSTWQAIDSWRASTNKASEADDKALKDLTDKWAALKPPAPAGTEAPPPVPASQIANTGALAATLLRIGDTLCPAGFDRWFRNTPGEEPSTAWIVLRDARQACSALALADSPSACNQLLGIRDKAHCLYPDAQISERAEGIAARSCPPRYWGRDYTVGNVVGNCERPIDESAAMEGGSGTRPAPASVATAPASAAAASAASAPAATVPAPAEAASASTLPAVDIAASTTPPVAAAPTPPPSPAATAAAVAAAAAAARQAEFARASTSTGATPPGVATLPAAVTERLRAGSGASSPPADKLRLESRTGGSQRPVAAAAPPPPLFEPASCAGKTLYVQVYARTRRADDDALRSTFTAAGATVPRSEDISARARLAGRATPTPVQQDTLRFHTGAEQACALALAFWLEQPRPNAPAAPRAVPRMEPLNPRLKPQPGVVEVWLAPPGDWVPR